MPAAPDDDRSKTAAPQTPQPAATPQIASFEEGLAALADLVARLESGGLGLSESIDAYERGVVVLRQLHEELARAEDRVSVLVRIDEEGKPVLAPHEAAAAANTVPAAERRSGRGKAGRPRSLPGMDEDASDA